jgi:hypothetical protein
MHEVVALCKAQGNHGKAELLLLEAVEDEEYEQVT